MRGARRSTNLHVTAEGEEGAEWSDRFAAADPFSRNLLLRSFGSAECRGIGWRLADGASGAACGEWVLADPVSEVRVSHGEHATLLRRICRRFAVGHVYVSSLAGHSLEVYRLGVPCTQVHHDLFPYCPAFDATRSSPCTSCGGRELAACRDTAGGHRPLASAIYYQRLRDGYFAAAAARHVAHVAPSASQIERCRRLDGRFAALPFGVVEPGLPHGKSDCFGGAAEGRRLRVGLLGPLTWRTGGELLRHGLESWRTVCDLYLVGAGREGAAHAGRWGVHLIPGGAAERLPALLADLRLDLVLLLHVVPLASALPLSLAACFCLPVATTRLGAPAERIEAGHEGFLVEPTADAVLALLLAADRDRGSLREVAGRLRARPVRSVEQEVAAYYRLRGDVDHLARRRLRQAPVVAAAASPPPAAEGTG